MEKVKIVFVFISFEVWCFASLKLSFPPIFTFFFFFFRFYLPFASMEILSFHGIFPWLCKSISMLSTKIMHTKKINNIKSVEGYTKSFLFGWISHLASMQSFHQWKVSLGTAIILSLIIAICVCFLMTLVRGFLNKS